MKNYYLESELASIGLKSDDFRADEQKRAELEKAFGSVATVVRYYNVSFYDGKFWPEQASDFLEYGGRVLSAYKPWNGTAWDLYLAFEPDGQEYATRPRPNKIGAATEKKMDGYLAWLLENEGLRQSAENEWENKKKEFIASLEGLEVKWDRDRNGGKVTKNGITFEFGFSDSSRYIVRKLTVHYRVDNSVEAFRALSENNYTL